MGGHKGVVVMLLVLAAGPLRATGDGHTVNADDQASIAIRDSPSQLQVTSPARLLITPPLPRKKRHHRS